MEFSTYYNRMLNEGSDAEDLPYPINKTRFNKNQIITSYGQVENNAYFLKSGIAAMTIKNYVSENIIDFFFENEMFTSLTSFLTQLPSDVQIKAMTECEVEVISYPDLTHAYLNSLSANKFGRIIIEQAYLRKAKREKDFLTKTAEERYAEMFHSQPDYISKIPVNKIAKYLGIHPESLSRIRKKLNS